MAAVFPSKMEWSGSMTLQKMEKLKAQSCQDGVKIKCWSSCTQLHSITGYLCLWRCVFVADLWKRCSQTVETNQRVCICLSVCSGAISSRYSPVGQRPVCGRAAQRGGAEGPSGEGGSAGGGDGSTDHQRGSRHPPPGEMHAGSGSSHHRWSPAAFILSETDFPSDGECSETKTSVWSVETEPDSQIHPVSDAAAALSDMWLSLGIQPSTLCPPTIYICAAPSSLTYCFHSFVCFVFFLCHLYKYGPNFSLKHSKMSRTLLSECEETTLLMFC